MTKQTATRHAATILRALNSGKKVGTTTELPLTFDRKSRATETQLISEVKAEAERPGVYAVKVRYMGFTQWQKVNPKFITIKN
jgi:hypothetical protein